MGIRFFTGLAAIAVLTTPVQAQELDTLLDEAETAGALIVQRLSDGREWTGGGDRLDRRFIPASTFKIPHSLILLETGVVSDPDGEALEWDGEEHWLAAWNQDQTLNEAFRRSTVWAYRQWARRAGHETLAGWTARLNYGNGVTGGPEAVDQFWLEGPLEISAREQIAFLSRLHDRDLPVRGAAMEAVIVMMTEAEGEDWTLRGKTGWRFDGEPDIGWYAGWLETGGEVYLFALNIDMPDPASQMALRTALTEAALKLASGWTGR